jgi:small subunit ribosomal protein S16
MAVKLRLQRHGRGKRPFYHIVATDSRAPRDGKYIERLGDYNPLSKPASIHLDVDKTVAWLQKGAEVTNTLKAILKYKGVLYKKHLLRGVAKNSLTTEEAEKRYQQWLDEHKNAVLDHEKKHHKDKTEIKAKLLEQEQKKAADREAKRQAALVAAEEVKKAAEAAAVAAKEEAKAAAAPAETTAPKTEA